MAPVADRRHQLPPPASMCFRPVRLLPGADLRVAIEQLGAELQDASGFVVSGIGSLVTARLRMADEAQQRLVQGPLEIISVAGSISPEGAHLHMSVADSQGQVWGGHVCPGCEVRTTAELLVAEVPGYRLSREFDPSTGFKELVVQPVGQQPNAANMSVNRTCYGNPTWPRGARRLSCALWPGRLTCAGRLPRWTPQDLLPTNRRLP